MVEPVLLGAQSDGTVNRETSSGSLSRSMSRMAGFQGSTVANTASNAAAVQRNQDQVLQQFFRRWILCFLLILGLLTFSTFGALIAMVAAASEARPCDMPLREWTWTMCALIVYNLLTCGDIQRDFAKCLCKWNPDNNVPTTLQSMPLRVHLFLMLVPFLTIVWDIVGLTMVLMSGSHNSDLPLCKEAEPLLSYLVAAFSALSLFHTAFLFVFKVGLSHVLRAAMNNGMLHTTMAAPPGALERNTEPALMGDPALTEETACSICLVDFSESQDMVKTKVCKHIFHKKCLQGWLNVNRNCPLCRRDLGGTWEP